MELSKREKMIMYGAIATFVLLVGNQFLLTPVMTYIDDTHAKRVSIEQEVETMNNILDRKNQIKNQWKERQENGLVDMPAATESAMYKLLNGEWQNDSGFSLPNVTRQRVENDTQYQEIVFTVSGSGTLKSAAHLLWIIEHSDMPVRISNLQMSSPEDDGRTINMTMRLSVLYLDPSKSEA